MLIEMKNISDIELYYSQIYSFNSDIENSRDIKLIECLNLQPVSWSSYNSSSNIITINSYNPNLVGKHCVKLSAIDGCGDANLSNNFNISIKFKNPPVFLEHLIPITLMKGEKRLFNYSKSFILDEDANLLKYKVYFVSGSKTSSYPTINVTTDDLNYYIYVDGITTGYFNAMVSLSDVVDQIVEEPLSISVFDCASKDCIKCKGNYEINCTLCAQNYSLDIQTGKCYHNYEYWPSTSTFYSIVGIIVFFKLIIMICFIPKLKRLSILPLKYIQIILIFLLSTEKVDREVIDLTSLLSIFSFNFEFLSLNSLNKLLLCHNDSKKMQNLHFNCASTLINYKCAIAILIIGIIVNICIRLLFRNIIWINNFISKAQEIKFIRYFSKFEISRFDFAWFIINFIFPFMLINLISDLINFQNSMILGFLSFLFILSVLCIIILSKFKIILPSFVKKIDPANIYIYTYADFARIFINACMFTLGDLTNYKAWLCFAFFANLAVVFIQSSEFIHTKFRATFDENYRKEHIIIFYEELWCIFIICKFLAFI